MNLRNICIIAHVDHGKTTLVDHLLQQAGTFAQHQAMSDRIMDSMDLERERGITIAAKSAAVVLGDTKINIVDTPGHADFGGEVERVMNMVDGAILLVDAAEGPLPQTRFVLQKALNHGHRIILFVNKVDRPEIRQSDRLQKVVNEIFDLFFELGATDEQAEFPILYGCGRDGWCTTSEADVEALVAGEKTSDLRPLFDLVLDQVPKPRIAENAGFSMLVSNLAHSEYVGRMALGRVFSGEIRKGQKILRAGVDAQGNRKDESFAVSQIYTFSGLAQKESETLTAGDIGIVAGSENVEIGDTLIDNEDALVQERIEVEKPTISMVFSVNTSPFSGQEGEAIQSRKLQERLLRETQRNVSIGLMEGETPDVFIVTARGELQLAVLIEQMRREGLEFMVGKPVVLIQKDDKGNQLEPFEKAVADVPEDAVGAVTQLFQNRRGILSGYENFPSNNADSPGRVRLEFEIPTRGLLGTRSTFLSITRGEGLLSSEVLDHRPMAGSFMHRQQGALVADRTGKTVEYAMLNLEDRGVFFMGPGVPVYEGMVIGEHAKDTDLNVNICKEKKLTNVRAAHAEILVTLSGLRQMSLEDCIAWIDDDEWIEVTPKSVRLRKKTLAQNMRSVRRK